MSPGLPAFAFVAGLLSITSPCALPLVPAYLSYLTSVPMASDGVATARRVAIGRSLYFVSGFAVIFAALGATASVLGTWLARNLDTVTVVAGSVIVAMGLAGLGLFRLPVLSREFRPGLTRVTQGRGGPILLGMAFAAGWTPCIGPILATVLSLAATRDSVLAGSALLVIYSMGLGLPFVALAVGHQRVAGSLTLLRRHGRWVERAGGGVLVLVGVSYITGTWEQLFRPLQRWLAQLGWPPI